MKILVFNGSPKGELSVTLQYIRYLEKVFSEHEFEIVPVAQKIRTLKRFVPRIREGMVRPLKKVVDRFDEKGL